MKIYQLLILLVIFLSCKKHTDLNTISMANTTKNFAYEPIYRLKITSSLSYNIKINGVTTATKNQNAGSARWFLINNCIPASGEQNIEITLLPRMSTKGTEHLTTIDEKDDFTLEVEKTSWKDGSLVEPTVIYSYELAKDAKNKKKHLHKAIFKADVPYQLIDWRDGKDLTKMDSTKLKDEVLKSYKNIKSTYANQKGEQYIKLIEKGIFNLAQGAYLNPKGYEDLKKDEIDFINEEPTPLENLENYILEISGNGRLVSLRRVDGYNAGEGVLRRRFKESGQELVYIDDITFYIPNNSDSLEVIIYQNLEKPYLP